MDGKFKYEDMNLVFSILLREGVNCEILGIIVFYKVKVKLVVFWGGDVVVELFFILMYFKFKEEFLYWEVLENEMLVDINFIEFDINDDDIVFEDFVC